MHCTRLSTALIVTVAMALLVVACHDDGSGAGTDTGEVSSKATPGKALSAGDLCRYVSADDASAALGSPAETVAQPAPINTAGTITETCAFTNQAGSVAVLFRESTPSAAALAFEGARMATAGAIDVPGIGETAFYSPSLGQLVTKKNSVYFIVTLDSGSGRTRAPTEALKRLAAAIAARI